MLRQAGAGNRASVSFHDCRGNAPGLPADIGALRYPKEVTASRGKKKDAAGGSDPAGRRIRDSGLGAGGSLQRLDELVDRHRGEGHDLDRPPRPQRHRDLDHRLVARGLDDVDEIVGAQDRILPEHLRPHPLDLLVHLLDALRLGFHGFPSIVGERTEQDVERHGISFLLAGLDGGVAGFREEPMGKLYYRDPPVTQGGMPPTSLPFGCGVLYNMESIRDNFRSMSGSELHRLASLTDRGAAGADGAGGWLIGGAGLVILIIVILMHTDRRVVVR